MNTYSYVYSNPLYWIDPYGLRGMGSGYPYPQNDSNICSTDGSLDAELALAIGLIIFDTITIPSGEGYIPALAILAAKASTKQILKGMSRKEARELMSKWDKSTYDTLSDSIRDHAQRHGFGDDIPKYLRKAANFNKKGAKRKVLEDGAIRWNRKNGEFLIERDGKIVTYGINK